MKAAASPPSKGEQTRQAIVSAAYDLIIRQGYAATSMRQIAQRSGLALGGIYNHFSSKEDVFRAIIEERHPFFQMIPLLSTVKADTVEEYVRNAAHVLITELQHHPEFLNLMLVEIVEFKTSHVHAVFERILPLMLPVAQRFAELKGDLRPIPPFVLMRAFMGMFFSYYITEMLMAHALPPALRKMNSKAIDYFVEIFLHGVLEPETA